ncbi:hypothetical protein VTP01DRAFT_10121 [Rhizomucor pusillus]|uniref:uncharacterized protein n=1 Tax=Rhizomucor pusillus TaxID=4840 RepID=UPI0037439044
MVLDYLTEKKLRPLYEAIDDGQNKQALQHANKLLKKNADWPLVKALKAVVLVRTGKDAEAEELCQQVKKCVPTDDATLQAVTMAYRELGHHHAVVELYENAANQQPKNEEFAKNWFMAMVRNGDYKGQQAAALKLHRTFKQDKYLFWAIMSLALQGQNSALSYTLAERMMAKAHEENRLEEVEHMRLYLLILLDQKKHKEALALLDGPLGQKSLRDPEVRQIRMELLLANEKWEQVLESAEQALRTENADDWISWQAYFDAVQALLPNDSSLADKAYTLVADLKKAALEASVLKRGPFLAELELDFRLGKAAQGSEQNTALEKIVAYFQRFGSKSCCFEDIQNYIKFLRDDKTKAKDFVSALVKNVGEPKEKSEQIKAVYKTVNIKKIERYLDFQTDLDLKTGLSLVNELWKLYQDALPLGANLEKTENQYGDEFILLASQILLDLYKQHQQPNLLIQAICMLENALLKSIYNFHIKLTLVRLYFIFGVHTRPMQILATMDIKQIQYDTMIHYFTDRYISLAGFDNLEDTLAESLMIYKSNELETPEMLVKAYQYGTYSKIQEFIEFQARLENSLQQAITHVELARLEAIRSSFQAKYAVQLLQEMDVSKMKIDDESISKLSDNRDFKVFMNCNSEHRPRAEELFKPTASSNVISFQLFSFIFHVASAACSVKVEKDLKSIVESFDAFIARQDIAQHVTPQEMSLAKYINVLAQALVLIKNPESCKSNAEQAAALLDKAGAILEKEITPTDCFREDPLSWHAFHKLFTALEAFNFATMLIEMINKALGLTSKDAKKKAADNAANDILLTALFKLQATVKDVLIKSQTAAHQGVDLFNSQFQKQLVKKVIDDKEYVTEYFATKEGQSKLPDIVKKMTSSWSSSVARLSEEFDRRVQKLQ